MKFSGKKLILILRVAFFAGLAKADSVPDAESWYRNSYAPLWNAYPLANVETILEHFAEEVITHTPDGEIQRDSSRSWLVKPMQGWVEQGWLNSELTRLDVQPINQTTVSFFAIWRDYYGKEVSELSCGWYLVDLIKSEWKITEYADRPCR